MNQKIFFKIRAVLFTALLLIIAACSRQTSDPTENTDAVISKAHFAAAQTYNLVWSDEFNGSSINTADWNFDIGGSGWGNNELQYYRAENARVENGQLVITARNESFGGKSYTSARLTTGGKRSFKYGKIEARIQLPVFQGSWPAFWMLGENIGSIGWPKCGEIDIMEQVNTEAKVYGTVHWDANGQYASYGGNTGTSPAQWHVYTIEWNAQTITWFVDGNQYHQVDITPAHTEEFHKSFFILLNMAVGGNWPGFSVNGAAMPAEMRVDYVRVYQLGAVTVPDTTVPSLPAGDTTLSGIYFLQNRHSGLYADVSGWGTTDGANILQWNYHGGGCQQFRFIHLGGGVYKIENVNSGRALDVADISKANGANVQQWGYSGGENQKFVVQNIGGGYYKLWAVHSGKLVEVSGFSTAPGGNVQQWEDAGQTSAQWRLTRLQPAFTRTIQAESYSAASAVQTETAYDIDGGLNVGWIDSGDWMAYNAISFPSSGNYKIEYRVASLSGGRLSSDLNAGSAVLGSLDVPATGGWQTWRTITQTVNINAGTYNFGIFAAAGGFNINWFKITKL